MRIGTWNLEGKWSPRHERRLREQRCDVWLLTEVRHDVAVEGWQLHHSAGDMAAQRWWAAVLAPTLRCVHPDPHAASVAARVDGLYVCSSVLPWRGATGVPWDGADTTERTSAAMRSLADGWPDGPIIWGGDWNHALSGTEYAGSNGGRKRIQDVLQQRQLQVPTESLGHRLEGCLSIDHVAVPTSWTALAVRVDAVGLSDHDAYVVEVTPRA